MKTQKRGCEPHCKEWNEGQMVNNEPEDPRPRPAVTKSESGMEKHVSGLPIAAVTRAFQMATRQAAINAVAAGRVVVGWGNGKLTEYDPGAPILPQDSSDDRFK